ncbi:hypothetical protein [Moorena sp. SIO4G3]|nr:hypothetical protein [Moorena sp. SIO4G3]NEO75515.1 hypothetical protein [Moorena sp. SIO4G3]
MGLTLAFRPRYGNGYAFGKAEASALVRLTVGHATLRKLRPLATLCERFR